MIPRVWMIGKWFPREYFLGENLACSWSGVECNENSTIITSLNLSMKNLAGKLPGKQLGVLTQLVGFNISQNSFSGELPVEIFNLANLRILDISRNNFSGRFPRGITGMKNLVHFDALSNSFSGPLPVEVTELESLKGIDIAGSNLSGSIPKELSNLTKLESLFLFRNGLTGPIPWEFGRIVPLTDLDLSDNLISGQIPESFAELKNLRLLSLMFNEMNGTVPESISELQSMETLFIWNNFFTGTLPKSLGMNSKLRWLDVSNNSFTGSIPPGICAGGKLFKLMLFSNSFTGNLSPLSNCSSLVRIRVEDNSFSGEIPLKFSDFPDITYIDLSKNRFTGGIPWNISRALKLQYFSVSNNPELGGTIPENIWSLPFLQNFSASYCNISGNLPPFRSCKSIVVVELQMTNISGSIPKSISDCHSLEMINLASNHLSDHIPKELASLPSLVFVDLSHNDLIGSIPVEFGESSSLVLLNVSYNDISGTIPSKKVLRSMGRSAYIGNPELCGKPLKSCSNPINGKKLRLILLVSAGAIILVAAIVFGLIYRQKGSEGQWQMNSFIGLPQFTSNDILRSFDCANSMEELPPFSDAFCKAVLPTGITVLVKKLEWEPKRVKVASEFITQLGSARHMNLIRLLGFCYNKQMTYLLYDYLPNGNLAEKLRMQRDWGMKRRIMIGIAKGLCFLHHDCNPAIPHGDLKSSNVIFDDNSEPRLADFGFKHLMQLIKGTAPATFRLGTGESNDAIKEELYKDIYNFGEIILEIVSNGKLINGGASIHSKPKDDVLREIYRENEAESANSLQEEIKGVVDVALICTRSSAVDRPSIEDALKLLSGLKAKGK
ncbi:dicer-like protein 4-like isoform X1 [Hibiscus syriacus]|uniref:Dicer-like protein 4-like isoform X1 n=1 Tax=Hibiscus syriacus TaxID=106335 RepID=A0A6A2ZNK4_HIBSY|nr:dicer-like protein 4-like isoform X1 [Hibiscus syriacus]